MFITMTFHALNYTRSDLSMFTTKRLWKLAATSLLVMLSVQLTAKADIVVLDDFSTALSGTGLTFSTTNSANKRLWSTVIIAPSTTATWSDSGAGILGGTRCVEATNANGIQNSTIAINGGVNGNLNVNSPGLNYMCGVCLVYNFALINVLTHHVFLFDVVAMDAAARQNLTATLTIKDSSGTAAVKTLLMNNVVVGRNKFEISNATNWSQLNKQDVVFAELSFATSQNAVDYVIDGIAFSTNPEPSTFVVIAIGFAAVAGVHWNRQRHARRTTLNTI